MISRSKLPTKNREKKENQKKRGRKKMKERKTYFCEKKSKLLYFIFLNISPIHDLNKRVGERSARLQNMNIIIQIKYVMIQSKEISALTKAIVN